MAGFETLNATLPSSDPCKDDGGKPLDACYTSEQRAVILQLLNNASPAELASIKLLRGRKSVNIVEHRSKNGPFKSLESVVDVPLLKHKSAVVVFNSILNPVKKERKVRIQLAKFIKPEVDRSWLEVSSDYLFMTTNFSLMDLISKLKPIFCLHRKPVQLSQSFVGLIKSPGLMWTGR